MEDRGYAYYTVSVENCSSPEEDLRVIQEICIENKFTTIVFGSDGAKLGPITWFTHIQDMKKISKKHPNVLFILLREGIHQENTWKEYHQNGKVQIVYPDLVWPEFDPEKLR